MSDKTRVKDLAVDLNMAPKDLMAIIKDLNIQAKVGNSVLADEEIGRIRERISNGAQSDRREGTDVIVRRRRKPDSASVPEAEPGDEAAPPAQPVQPAHAASPVAAAVAEEKAPAKVEKKAEAKKKKTPPATARIVSRPPSPAAAAQPVQEAEAPAPAEAVAQDPAAVPDQAAAQAQKEQADAPPARQPEAKAAPSPAPAAASGEDKKPAESGIRVISRPTVIARPAAQPAGSGRPAAGSGEGRREWRPGPRPGGTGAEGAGTREYRPRPGGTDGARPAGPRPGGSRPGAPRPGGTDGGRPSGPRPGGAGGYGAPAPGPAPEEGDRSKKRQKGKRTVEFGAERDGRFGKGQDAGDGAWMRSGRGKGKNRKGGKPEVKPVSQPLKAAKRKIRMEEFIRVSDLAHQMGLKAGEIIKVLFALGIMATINQSLELDTAALVAAEFGYEVEKVGFSEEEFLSASEEDDPEKLVTRPPVVTIMGHVDHGKTSLLDAIRKTSVTAREAGGITQHIGAYHVHTKKGDIVFLDTPGHEAFTAMRARGAEVTDIVVLVVAADDGVMEQTREAINHAKAAGVPIMVAVNKMDKEAANPDRVKRELADVGMVPEEWGGDTTFSYMSAKTRQGLDDFLELLALQAEILELKANPDKLARGHIVEAKLDKGRGALGTVLIQGGTLRVGDSFVCGVHHGRVRAMFDDQGQKVSEAGPSMPVEVQGFEGVPEAGEEFVCLADEKAARRIAETRATKQRERELAKESKVTLETFLASRGGEAESLVLNLVVKADVQGSLEAILDQLKKLSTEKVRINIIHGGAGAISESDVLLASTSGAIIIGFNVRPNPKTKELADRENVDIRFYDIIYKLAEEIKSAMEGLLAPVEKEVALGQADVRETFSVPKVGTIAGCHVSDGKITRSAQVRLLRDGVVVFTGRISSLKRFKDDAREVLKGYECGIGIENFNDVKVGDAIEAFEIVEEAATL
ncbi:MAG: translation initiation factor IF-2 [Deltaproteobacteria bacterium]|nr:translation initiation factor IF-2 [Deltaproteobacteria bacterium]